MKYVLLITLIFGLQHLYAQDEWEEQPPEKQPTGHIGVTADHSNYLTYQTTSLGLTMEYVGKRLGVSYTFGLGFDSEKRFYGYTGIGQVAGAYLLGNVPGGGGEIVAILGFIGIVIPESFYVNFYQVNGNRIAIYASPWGVEYRVKRSDEEIDISGEVGVKYGFHINKIALEPTIGIKKMYGEPGFGLSFGLNFVFNRF